MAKSTKERNSNWHLSFEISPEPIIGSDGQSVRKAMVIARQGDLAYMTELELVNWSEDIAAFFEQVRSVFFQATVDGLPEFPNMEEPQAALIEEVTSDDDHHTGGDPLSVQHELFEDDETGQTFTVALYGEQQPAGGDVAEEHLPDDDQLSLFPDDDYYAALADERERE